MTTLVTGDSGSLCPHLGMDIQIHTVRRLVEGTVKGGEEEHDDLSTHTQIQEEVGSRQVGQFKQGTQDNDRGTPAIGIVQECLARHAVHPFLQLIDEIQFTILCHYLLRFDFLLFTLSLVVFAILRTQRNPI